MIAPIVDYGVALEWFKKVYGEDVFKSFSPLAPIFGYVIEAYHSYLRFMTSGGKNV